MRKIAVLTSGGDAPGMNSAVVAVARTAAHYGMPLIGIHRGYNGIIIYEPRLMDALEKKMLSVVTEPAEKVLVGQIFEAVRSRASVALPDTRTLLRKYRGQFALYEHFSDFVAEYPVFKKDLISLDLDTQLDIQARPGTHLHTARCLEFKDPANQMLAALTLTAIGVEGVVVVGGDGSFNGASKLCSFGMPCIGIPGTIDNDLTYTDMTLGFDTATNVCLRSAREVRATSLSHDRPHVMEVMGRNCGDIALRTAIASHAEICLVPEVPWSVEDVAKRLQAAIDMGDSSALIVVAEGAYSAMADFDVYSLLMAQGKQCFPGEPMTAFRLADCLKYMCKDADGHRAEVRATVVGYTQRGDSPTTYDAVFAFESGNMAVRLLMEGKENLVIGSRQNQMYSLPISEALTMQSGIKGHFNRALYDTIQDMNTELPQR